MTLRDIHPLLVQFHREEIAQDLIEYALIGTIVSLGALAGMSTLASSVNAAFSHISEKLT
jgi:Flp pilus assembly pilin Flp